MVTSLDRGQAAAASYLHPASPAKDTLNGPKTNRSAHTHTHKPLQPADPSSLFSFQWESRSTNSRRTREHAGQAGTDTVHLNNLLGRIGFISEENGVTLKV